MATDADTRDAATASRVSHNLDLLRRFTLRVFEEPSLLNEIPNGGTLVFIPDDDLELAETNLRGGMRLVREGQNITFRHVRATEYPKERRSRW